MPQFRRRPDAGGRHHPLHGLCWEEWTLTGEDPARAYLDRGILGEARRSVPCGRFPIRRVLIWRGVAGWSLGMVGELESCHGNGREAKQERGATRWAAGEEVKLGAPMQGPALRGGARGWSTGKSGIPPGGGQQTVWSLEVAHWLGWPGVGFPTLPPLRPSARPPPPPLSTVQWSGCWGAGGGPWHRVIKTSVSLMKSYPLPGRGRHKSL